MTPADQAQRDAAVRERKRNVMIDAGAGTGKTTTIVRRLVGMLAPEGKAAPIPIDRIAAITFTRRAAGELRLRLREELVRALADPTTSSARREPLQGALEGLETAYIGTIHSFAERLLRLRPVEARLSPTYELDEEPDALVHETYERLLRAVEAGTLADELADVVPRQVAEVAQDAFADAIDSGVRLQRLELEFMTRHGLDSLVEGFIFGRDVPPDVGAAPFDPGIVRGYIDELVDLASTLPLDDDRADIIRRVAEQAAGLREVMDPRVLYRQLVPRLDRVRRRRVLKTECAPETWDAFKALLGDKRKNPVRVTSLIADITAPLQRWLAHRLAQAFPAVVALYEQVKQSYGLVDHVDLMLQLRNLLRDNPSVRGDYQALFDHVFVDEFQDTDPLQAEIVFYLCEAEPLAKRWDEVELMAGKLTIVGDPKQSIYRFRRADVAVYAAVQDQLRPQARTIRLACNFRSHPALIDWLNDRMEAVLQAPPGKAAFDAATGQVFHQPLKHGRDDDHATAVHVVPFRHPDKKAEPNRKLEAATLASYLRWLVQHGHVVTDPETTERRPVRFGDVAVLCLATPQLRLLLDELDAAHIPHTVSGGRLFLEDPLHQQFILGLRALADRDDGVAKAALFRPPFFAVDLDDHLQARAKLTTEGAKRLEQARQIVRGLRRQRFDRSAGATARALLEQTAFGRAVALGPNGEQRLARLRELCEVLDEIAWSERRDFDGATAKMRGWLGHPPQLDAPRPVDSDAVQLMTVHQAKGLEFPVVVLWDGMAKLTGVTNKPPWRVDRTTGAWAVALDGLSHCEPVEPDLASIEKDYLDNERRRLIYVAATRSRDLLVLPKPAAAGTSHISTLLTGGDLASVDVLAEQSPDAPAPWTTAIDVAPPPAPTVDAALEKDTAAAWPKAVRAASRAHLTPQWATEVELPLTTDEDDPEEAMPKKRREGRHGRHFGTVVHEALETVILQPEATAAEAVAIAAAANEVTTHLAEARADVERALSTLKKERLGPGDGPSLRVEYPIAAKLDDGHLTIGTIDLLAANDEQITILDFKTDTPPDEGEPVPPRYAAQLATYARLLQETGLSGGRRVRSGLLFTGSGEIRWTRRDTH